MNPRRNEDSTLLAHSGRLPVGFAALLFGCLTAISLTVVTPSTLADETTPAVLEFTEPTNNAVFPTLNEIPIVLRASTPNDLILTSDIFADQQQIGTASYCCWLCPCAHPLEGQETILQIPFPWQAGIPSPRIWQGWTNAQVGLHRLTAQAVSEKGSNVQSATVTITVIDPTLYLYPNVEEGGFILRIPRGAMVPGGYDLEVSGDLVKWTRLGPFGPGNVAAFYWDYPPENAQQRFYRSVYVPPITR